MLAARHRDGNNAVPSGVVAVGNIEGGAVADLSSTVGDPSNARAGGDLSNARAVGDLSNALQLHIALIVGDPSIALIAPMQLHIRDTDLCFASGAVGAVTICSGAVGAVGRSFVAVLRLCCGGAVTATPLCTSRPGR